MKKSAFILLGIVLVPYTAFAATNCRVVEYPDHYEAICTGDAPPAAPSPAAPASPASVTASTTQPAPAQLEAQPQEHHEQTFEELQAAQEAQQANADGDITIVVSDLGRRHAEQWLRTLQH